MVNYQNGKVYKIEPIVEHEENETYIGSTTKEYLSQRFQEHKSAYKRYQRIGGTNITVYKLFDKYGVDNCQIVLLEAYPSDSKDKLFSREAHYIKTVPNVNKTILGRTDQEYYQEHKQKIIQQVHLYASNNKDKIKERGIKYRQEHKEEIKARKSKKEICDICGTQYAHNHKQRHLRSKFCQNVKANRI